MAAHLFRNPRHELWAGVALVGAGTYLIWCYERRGRKLPFAARFVPGL